MNRAPAAEGADRALARRGVVFILLAAVLWSFNGPIVKLVHQAGADMWTIAFYRSLIAGLLLTPIALRRLGSNRLTSGALVSVVAFTAMTVCFIGATTMTQAANAIVLQYTAPIWVFIFAPWLLGERAERRDRVILVLALVGVVVIFAGQGATPDLPGLLVGLAAGFTYGLLMVVLRWLRGTDTVVITCANALGSALLLLPVTAALSTFGLDGRQLAYLVLLGALTFGLPYLLFTAGLRTVSAHRAVLLTLIEPVLNATWTWLIVGEVPHRTTLIGGAVILAAVALQVVLSVRRMR